MTKMQFEFDDSKSSALSRFRGNRRSRNRNSSSTIASSSTATTAASSNNPSTATSTSTNRPYQTPINTSGVGNTTLASYQLHSNPSIDNTEDGSVSLTYSASSSQAGESTDSSVADLGVLLQLEKEHQHHLLQQKQAQRMRNGGGGNGNGGRVGFSREKSNCDSLGYSDDDDVDSLTSNYAQWMTITGSQPSDSYAHDGGSTIKNHNSHGPSPKHNNYTNKKYSSTAFSSPQSITADLGSCTGSNGTPNTPPPRHSSKKSLSHDTEVWYQKWWMCGFTDALNLNPKCLD